MNEYQKSILAVIRAIPAGKVMSYGQVAAYIGRPKEAREVGWTLQKIDADFPWWRVLNNAGIISIKDNPTVDATMQKHLLEKEGVIVDDNFKLNIDTYRHFFDENHLQTLALDSETIQTILVKYSPPIDKEESQQLTLF
jgi:methylated-DNA-protein-cysteine methyltransferase-like protein